MASTTAEDSEGVRGGPAQFFYSLVTLGVCFKVLLEANVAEVFLSDELQNSLHVCGGIYMTRCDESEVRGLLCSDGYSHSTEGGAARACDWWIVRPALRAQESRLVCKYQHLLRVNTLPILLFPIALAFARMHEKRGDISGRFTYSWFHCAGHVGWGISWYINGLLIPEINVVRGKTYTFVVEGGVDPDTPARYHPFYITDDPVGGYEHKTPEERAKCRRGKDCTAMLIECAIATTCKALNWHAVFSSCCVYLWDLSDYKTRGATGGREDFSGSVLFSQSHAINRRELGVPLLKQKNGFLELHKATKTTCFPTQKNQKSFINIGEDFKLDHGNVKGLTSSSLATLQQDFWLCLRCRHTQSSNYKMNYYCTAYRCAKCNRGRAGVGGIDKQPRGDGRVVVLVDRHPPERRGAISLAIFIMGIGLLNLRESIAGQEERVGKRWFWSPSPSRKGREGQLPEMFFGRDSETGTLHMSLWCANISQQFGANTNVIPDWFVVCHFKQLQLGRCHLVWVAERATPPRFHFMSIQMPGLINNCKKSRYIEEEEEKGEVKVQVYSGCGVRVEEIGFDGEVVVRGGGEVRVVEVRVFAGVKQTRRGPIPMGTGRLCNWTPDPKQPPADEFASFGAYQRTLTLECDEGEPGVVQWTPDQNTPDVVYYQLSRNEVGANLDGGLLLV
ncbi:hypothetical protein PR048_019633 [Dryococelus australis]|uniref:Uncharacterized protein n=1 Tax=Dryococelus australis TaxID=614101 RepID=A0ABQ9H445_9NEOP|nr:hypothetical protein PR048_019633 [Dryococelus australis]